MKKSNRLIGCLSAMLVFSAAFLMSGRVFADGSGSSQGITSGVSLGGLASYYYPKGGSSSLSGGAQLRLHLTPVIAVEGLADYNQETVNNTTVDVYPLQASLLLYLMPSMRLSPYILGGVGWYHTHVQSPSSSTQDRFGPHAGFGLELVLNSSWSVDGDYRYLWNGKITNGNRNFGDNGSMLTVALNYHL